MKSWVPNGLTLINLALGIMAIFWTAEGHYYWAAWAIIGSLVADGLDGRAARALGISGEFGKELDSLCDAVSFGVAPAYLMYHFAGLKEFGLVGIVGMLLFALCGVLRLARFNVMVDEIEGYFLGMPIPTGGCLVATYVISQLNFSPLIALVFLCLWGPLMVSSFRYPDFKGKDFPINKLALGLSLFIAIGLVYMSWQAIGFAIFFSYMAFGILNTLLVR